MKKVFVMISAGLLVTTAVACGGAGTQTRKDTKTGDQVAQAGDSGQKAPAVQESAEDLSYREIVTREFKYVEGINEDAQDAFGQGVLFLNQFPPNYERAVESFKKAIEKDPSFPEAYFNLGQIYERQGKPMDAIRVYEAAGQKTDAKLDSQAYIGKVYLAMAKKAHDTGMNTEGV
nr:tetratricopeptide repeat protein [Myxococcota bacterium]